MPQDLINPARVDFVTLRLFCAVAQSGSITQGARHCHLALSAASRRLSDFEAAAGAQLLERSARGVVLTAAGRLALQHAARLFQGFELFSNELSEHASGARGHVRLWANMSALVQFLPATLADFMARSPGTRVEVEEQLSGDIARAVQDGLADLGICAAGVPARPGPDAFRRDRLVVVALADHALAARDVTDFRRCLAYDFVGLNRGSSLLDTLARGAGRRPAAAPAHPGAQLRRHVRDDRRRAGHRRIAAGRLRAAAGAVGLTALRLEESWAERQLLIAASAERPLSASAALLLRHLRDGADA